MQEEVYKTQEKEIERFDPLLSDDFDTIQIRKALRSYRALKEAKYTIESMELPGLPRNAEIYKQPKFEKSPSKPIKPKTAKQSQSISSNPTTKSGTSSGYRAYYNSSKKNNNAKATRYNSTTTINDYQLELILRRLKLNIKESLLNPVTTTKINTSELNKNFHGGKSCLIKDLKNQKRKSKKVNPKGNIADKAIVIYRNLILKPINKKTLGMIKLNTHKINAYTSS